MKLSPAQLVTLATGAGLALDSEKPDLLPYQTFLVFRDLARHASPFCRLTTNATHGLAGTRTCGYTSIWVTA